MSDHSDNQHNSAEQGRKSGGDAPKLIASPSIIPESGKRSSERRGGDVSSKLIVVKPQASGWSERSWEEAVRQADPDESFSANNPKPRRNAFVALMVMAVAIVGVAGGSLATSNFNRSGDEHKARLAVAAQAKGIGEAIARLEADVAALKASIDKSGKQTAGQIGKTNERLAQLEKSQAEPAARIAKLTEAVEKLSKAQHAAAAAPAPAATPAPAPVPAPVATAPAAAATPAAPDKVAALPRPDPRDVTGSIPSQPRTTAAAQPRAPRIAISRMPIVPGWVLLEARNGVATIEGRRGVYEVYPGDPVPGVGRVDAIRKQDGQWVVVTDRGLIVAD